MRIADTGQQSTLRRSPETGSRSWFRFMAVGGAFALLVVALGGLGPSGRAAGAQPPFGLGCEASASTPVPQPTQAELDAAGLGDIPLAPDSARVDLVAAPFSDSTP